MGVLRKCARATPDFGPSGRQQPAACSQKPAACRQQPAACSQKPVACRHPPAASRLSPAAPILALLLLLLAACSPTPPPTPTAIPSPTPSPTFTPEPTPTPPRIEALVPLSGPAEHYPFGIEGAKPLPEDIGLSAEAISYEAGVVSVVEMGDEGPLVAVVTELEAGEGGSFHPTGRVALFLTAGREPLELGEVELEKGAVVDCSADRSQLVVKNPDGTTQTLLSPLPTSGKNGVFFGCSGPKLAWVVERDGKTYTLPAVDIAWEKPAELADKISEAQWRQIRGALIEAINTYLLEQAKGKAQKEGKSLPEAFADIVQEYDQLQAVLSPTGEDFPTTAWVLRGDKVVGMIKLGEPVPELYPATGVYFKTKEGQEVSIDTLRQHFGEQAWETIYWQLVEQANLELQKRVGRLEYLATTIERSYPDGIEVSVLGQFEFPSDKAPAAVFSIKKGKAWGWDWYLAWTEKNGEGVLKLIPGKISNNPEVKSQREDWQTLPAKGKVIYYGNIKGQEVVIGFWDPRTDEVELIKKPRPEPTPTPEPLYDPNAPLEVQVEQWINKVDLSELNATDRQEIKAALEYWLPKMAQAEDPQIREFARWIMGFRKVGYDKNHARVGYYYVWGPGNTILCLVESDLEGFIRRVYSPYGREAPWVVYVATFVKEGATRHFMGSGVSCAVGERRDFGYAQTFLEWAKRLYPESSPMRQAIQLRIDTYQMWIENPPCK